MFKEVQTKKDSRATAAGYDLQLLMWGREQKSPASCEAFTYLSFQSIRLFHCLNKFIQIWFWCSIGFGFVPKAVYFVL